VTWAVLSIALGGLAILGLLIGRRWLDARAWQRSLTALSLRFPRGLTTDQVGAWLAMLASLRVPLALEIVATREAVAHYLLVPEARQADVLAGTRGVLPGLRMEAASDYLADDARSWRAACELRISHLSRQLAAERAETAVAAFLGSLGHLEAGEAVLVQWLVAGMATPEPRAADDPARDLARAEKVKHAHPLMRAVGRVATQAATPGRAHALLDRITGSFRLLDAAGVAVVRRSMPSSFVVPRLEGLAWPLAVWPFNLNVREAVGLVGIPLGEGSDLPGLALGRTGAEFRWDDNCRQQLSGASWSAVGAASS